MKNKLINTRCPICSSSKNYKVIYRKNFSFSDFNDRIFSARRVPDKIHYRLVKCKNDGLVRSNPIIEGSTLEDLYKKSKFTYHDEVDNLTDTYYDALSNVLGKLDKNCKILEVGCGNGFVLDHLYRKGFKNVYGIEPSTDAKNNSPKNISRKIVTKMLTTNIFPKNNFDLIFFFQTFDHISDPNKFLKICHTLLKKGGYILSFNHDIDSLSSKLLGEKSPIIDIEHICLYSHDTMRLIFNKNGFTDENVYSPSNTISLRHFIWLFPLPYKFKKILLESNYRFMNFKVKIKLGNVCYIGKK